KVLYVLSDTFQYEADQEFVVRNYHNCKNYILNSLSNELYDVYLTYELVKDIWSALAKKYVLEEAGAK
ncbi:hypothetical protein PJI17_32640, partial [Mycobacterium kansasii]